MYWVLLLVVLIPPFLSGGMEGVWGKLMHLARVGLPFEHMTPATLANQIHRMWQAQFLLLAMTWAACSVQRRLSDRLRQSTNQQ